MSATGHRVVLTGASGGLGSAFALALAPKSSAIVLCGRDHVRLQALQQKLQALHPGLRVETVAGDLRDPVVQTALFETADSLGDPIDLLVNAAGVGEFGDFERRTAADMERLIGINLLAPMQIAQRLLPLLVRAPQAQIVNIGSIFGYIGYPGFAVYCATKFGLRGFSQALRRELSDTNVTVRYFAPRAVRTPLNSPAVVALNRELGNTEDAADSVAQALVRFVGAGSWDRRLGFPERLYVWLNRFVPAVNDRAIRGQLGTIRRHFDTKGVAPINTERSRP